MTMTLEQVLQASAAELEFLATKDQLNVTDHDRHLRLLASLRNAIAHLAQPRAVPDGWVLVPREPTVEMMNAAWAAGIHPDFPAGYAAMLAAAPSPGLSR